MTRRGCGKGLSELKDLRHVRHREWPDDVADYLSNTWPFNHNCYQWHHYNDLATFADTLTVSQEGKRYVPRVGGGEGGQPCRILARPSGARHVGEGVRLLSGRVRVTTLAMMAYALGGEYTMEAIYQKYLSMVLYSTTRKRESHNPQVRQARGSATR